MTNVHNNNHNVNEVKEKLLMPGESTEHANLALLNGLVIIYVYISPKYS